MALLAWFLLLVDACFEHAKCVLLLPLLFRWEEDLVWFLSLGFFCLWMHVLNMLNVFSYFHCYSSGRKISLGSSHLVFLVHGDVF